jgi:hypothetical protein
VRLVAILALVVGLTTVAVPSIQAQTAAPADRGAEKPKRAVRNVSGKVRSAGGDVIVVTGRDKGKDAEWTFAIGPTTHIRRGSQSIVATDLKPGEAVQVRYLERDGKAQAESILVKGPRK